MDSVTTTSTRLFNDKFGARATTSHPHINEDITMKLYQKFAGSAPPLKPKRGEKCASFPPICFYNEVADVGVRFF